jgi:ATP-dependent helicase HepA
VHNFIPGQRCISNAELEMGLGTVLAADARTVTIVFIATGDTRIYSLESAPITRVMFTIGDTITSHRGETIRVTEIEEDKGLVTYIGVDAENRETRLPEAELDNFIQLNRPSERLFHGQVDPEKWFELRHRTLTFQNRLAHSDLYGLTGSRTSLIPHQLYIAHEVANRYAPRVLLADEVGLGKTIEAGLILHHQLLTGRARRVLIVVPDALVNQWLVEMLRRFNLHFKIFDEQRWPDSGNKDTDENTVNPFLEEQLALTSLTFLAANTDVYQQALAGEWDLLVVDEAHHLEWSPDKTSPEYQLVEQLAGMTRGALLLTATPEQLGKESHFARLHLLDPDRFSDFEKFLEEEKQYKPVAQTITDLVDDKALSEADRAVIRSTLEEGDNAGLLAQLHLAGKEDDAGSRARAELVEHLLDRHGTGRVLFRNTRATIRGFPQREVYPAALPCPGIYRDIYNKPGTLDSPALLATPERLDPVADWTGFDPRVAWLNRLLKTVYPAKILVIAAHRQTALDIAGYLKAHAGIHAAVFHEGLSIVERDRAAAYFADTESGTQVLVCSEIGSEGRNFQFAHHLVLFDLPLNPDLLEQRIGRLDRIGQTETIRIHVPYLENTPQSVLFDWYQEGLNAFQHTCPVGHAVYTTVREELFKALHKPNTDTFGLVGRTRTVNKSLMLEMQAGRDRLLEFNSCRKEVAEDLRQRAEIEDSSGELPDYMNRAFDCLGIDSETHSDNCLIIRPSGELVNQVPGLPEDGLTITFDRATALSFEDAQYLTWEHPLVRTIMDMVASTEMGNTALTAVSKTPFKSGSMLLECLYRLDVPPVATLQSQRYLPTTSIRVVIDESGNSLEDALTMEVLDRHRTHVPANMFSKIIHAKEADIRQLLEIAENRARGITPAIIEDAHQKSSELLMREINRLKALRQVNPNIRNEEVSFFEEQLEALNSVLDTASLRLDGVRIIAVL